MEQQTGSKLGKQYVKAIYCHPAYLTYMQSTLLFESFQEVLLKLFIVNNHRYLQSEKMGGGRIKG